MFGYSTSYFNYYFIIDFLNDLPWLHFFRKDFETIIIFSFIVSLCDACQKMQCSGIVFCERWTYVPLCRTQHSTSDCRPGPLGITAHCVAIGCRGELTCLDGQCSHHPRCRNESHSEVALVENECGDGLEGEISSISFGNTFGS